MVYRGVVILILIVSVLGRLFNLIVDGLDSVRVQFLAANSGLCIRTMGLVPLV